jgi:hypothetical protein
VATVTATIAVLSMPIARAAEITEQQAYDIGPEAYTYLYPLGTMDLTRKHATNIEADKMPGRGPMNTFSYPVLSICGLEGSLPPHTDIRDPASGVKAAGNKADLQR